MPHPFAVRLSCLAVLLTACSRADRTTIAREDAPSAPNPPAPLTTTMPNEAACTQWSHRWTELLLPIATKVYTTCDAILDSPYAIEVFTEGAKEGEKEHVEACEKSPPLQLADARCFEAAKDADALLACPFAAGGFFEQFGKALAKEKLLLERLCPKP